MRKDEFEELADMTVSDSDYEVIEKVYTFHPAVRGTSGKNEIAELYKSFGMAIFYDMLPRAEKNCELEKQLRQVQAEEERIRQEIGELAHCCALKKVCAIEQYGMETVGAEADVGSNEKYERLLDMDAGAFSRFIRNWTRRHLKDDDLCEGQVEQMFQTPVSIYRKQFNHES